MDNEHRTIIFTLTLTLTLIQTTAMGKFSEAFGHGHHKEEPQPPPPSFAEATSSTFVPPNQGQGQGKSQFADTGSVTYACLLLSSQDKLRTVNFPEHAITPIQEGIQRVWQAGIQQQGYKTPQNYEWKLKGNPCTPKFTVLI